ncbi:MAG: aspartate-semialdehyde dehydrogenase [Armatimonadetes bacterium]|nr:aspartate-semialdehyde dehydrogenase [Armatimonadota bacterium]
MNVTNPLTVAVVGATGAVGRQLVRVLEQRGWPIGDMRLLASARSAGKTQAFDGGKLTVKEATDQSFEGADVAFFCAGADCSKELVPHALKAGATVIDNSSAFRMDPEVPLVVPEINGDVLSGSKLIANPNCTAIITLMAVAPLRSLGTIERVVMSSYQSASGAGAKAMQELQEQTRALLDGGKAQPDAFPHQCAFNVFSHDSPIDEDGYNVEERKVIEESRKILGDPDLRVNVTCVRVPVLRAHSVSVTVEFAGDAPDVASARDTLSAAPGVRVVDDRAENLFPMPCDATGQDDVLVGRIRQDLSNPSALCLFASGDQLLKGAALNAVQIAERVLPVRR